MSVEDKRMSRLLEHELHRFQSLDLTDVLVSVSHGVGYIGGILRPMVGMYNVNMKEETRLVHESLKRTPGLRDLVIDAKIETSSRR